MGCENGKKMCCFSPKSKLCICWTLQTTDRKLLSVNHDQIALLCLSETWEKKNHYFLQCLTLQPQCKHSLTLFVWLHRAEVQPTKTTTKRKKKKKQRTEKQNWKHHSLSLSSFTLWDVSSCPVLLFFNSCFQPATCSVNWWPVVDKTFSI